MSLILGHRDWASPSGDVWAMASAGLSAAPVGARVFAVTAGAVCPGDESQPCWCGCHFCFCSRCKWRRASPRDHPCVCARLLPRCAQQPASGARAYAHIRVPHTHACPLVCAWALGEPTSQTTECPVWEHGLSLLLTEFGVEGAKQEGAGFRPQGPPTERQAGSRSCLWACEGSW